MWHPRLSLGMALVLGIALLLPSVATGQRSAKPLTKDEVVTLLKGEVPSSRVADLARERGITFAVTQQTESELRAAGAEADLVRALRQLTPRTATPAPATPSPPPAVQLASPVLVVEAKPGGAQVYVDDELVGTTSQQGRLRLSQIPAGEHRVRLALAGYEDHESRIDLRSGETTRLVASLVSTRTASPTGSAGAEKTAAGTSSRSATQSSIEEQFARLLGSQSGESAATAPGTAGPLSPDGGFQSFTVAHDHGPPAPNYCVGVMMVGNGMIGYRSANGMHWFQSPLSEVKEAKKNTLYLAAVGGFHITLKNGQTFNFVVMNSYGQYEPPDALLNVVNQAMRRR